MKKREPWGLIIVDEDRKKYAFTGVITDDSAWTAKVAEEQKKGRNIRCFSHKPSDDHNLPEWKSRVGVVRTNMEEVLSTPEDTSAVYRGALPPYAARANRLRVVQILCRGKCRKTRWAELDADYPGEDALKKAELGEFHARCLMCGYRASGNYNWTRD